MFELVDLHTHSNFSDGVLPPAELVARAALRKVTVLALTDHDSVSGCEAALTACRAAGIGMVPGAELTTSWRGQELHIVGLGLDPEHALLRSHLEDVLERRRRRIRAMGEKLRNEPALAGRNPADGLLDGTAVPTRTHLARALVDLQLAGTVQQAFDRYLSRRRPAYVAQEWPDPAATIAAIHAAGGIAVLAHAHRYKLSNGGLKQLCAAFKSAGGDGLEVSLPGLSPTDATRLASLARANGLAGSMGSDFHEPDVPWRPLGRFAKLPDGVASVMSQLSPI